MRYQSVVVMAGLCLLTSGSGIAQKKPTDVRPNHPSTQAVQQVLDTGVMAFTDGTNFRGEAKVTRTQAVIAIAKLARAVETRQWKAKASVAVPGNAKNMQVVDTTQPVTRYTLANALSRFGNYLANGLPRPAAVAKDLAKSEVLPERPRITVASSHPAYASLTYLVERRMLWPGSPLLKPDDKPLQSAELSQALAEMATGLTNLWSELGKDELGNTIDQSSRKKK